MQPIRATPSPAIARSSFWWGTLAHNIMAFALAGYRRMLPSVRARDRLTTILKIPSPGASASHD